VARSRLHSGLVAVASAGLIASSLWGIPAAAEQTPAPTDSPTPTASPSAEPTPDISPAPSPELSPTPTPSPSPVEPTREPSASASPSAPASPSPTSSPSSSPSAPSTLDGPMTERIIRIAGEQYRADVEQRIDELGGEIFGEYTETVDGFAARLSSKAAFLLAETEGIEAIEENIELTMQTSAIRTDNFCTSNSLGKTDDGGTFPLALGFNVNWFGLTYNEILINNNGGAAFNNDFGRFQDFTGINLTTTNRPLLLPLFTDIDTTNASASSVTFGSGTIAGENAYCVNWVNVGEFSSSLPKFSFQLVIIDKSGSGNAGDVDIEFNYSQVGIPTANTNGKFVIGYSVPHSRTDSLVRVSSSDTPSLFADGGALALTSNKYPSSGSIVGRYTFEIRPDSAGSAPTPDPIATPIASAGNCNGLTNPSTTLSGYANTYCDVVWGLDRIDQRPLPLNDEFSPAGDGTGVKAYVVDTGLKTDHQEFTGRVDTGRNFFGTDQNGDTSVADCNGHGTHVASTLAGSRYGVAKDATIVPVRVFGCSGGTTVATILNALDWIAVNHPNASPGVVNMSLGGGANTTLDQAVQCLTGLGSGCTNNALTVVVAAGNSNTTASSVSPARVAEAITVGSATSVDSRSGFSNYGSAVDIFAPGSGITAAWYTSTTATATISGTSMASPHVAGAAAVYLENNTSATPSQVLSALVDDATQNALTDIGSGSPNKLLFIGGLPIVTSVSPNFSAATSTASVTITGENLDNSSGNSVVEFGAGRAASWSSESDTQLVVTSPTGTAGAVDLIIDNGRGDQRIMNAFTYTSGNANAPTIAAISPAEGPTGGGQTVTITGTNLEVNSENTSVAFGEAPAQVTSATTTQLQVRTPPGTAGNVIVSVTTSEGSSTSNYAYVAAPNITSLSTQSGPIAGGTQVTVTGSNLALTSSVTVGGVSATLGAVTASSVEFTTPQRPSATVNSYTLELTTPGGTVTLPSAFTYVPAPSISSIASLGQLTGSSTTLSGPAAGGTGVRILGSNLGEVTAVRFGSTAATFTRESGSSIIAISPAGSGTVSITVVSPGGSATLANAFQYEAAQTGGVGGGVGGGGGGVFIPPASGGGGGGGGGADVKPTRPAVTSNQVDSPGQFRIIDDSGRGVRLNRAELSNTGLVIAGDEWSLSGSGPLTASSTDVAPGSMFTFAGEGLERLTTVGIYVLSEPTWVASGIVGFDGKFQTSFAMPALEPGQHTLQVNAVLADEIPISIGVGFTLTGTTVPAKEAASPALESNSAADFALFRGQSSALTKATRTKLTQLAQRFPTTESKVVIVAFTDSRGTPASKRRAQARAEKLQNFLQGAGFAGSIQIVTEPGSTNLQSRGALVYVQPAGTSTASVNADSVRSLIVRLKKGRSITVDGEVRGSDKVTGPIGDSLTVGLYLGLRMYRVDFAEPVSEKVAQRVAKQLMSDPGIEFAEPDSIVSTQVSLAS
jgi:hypothetical protein